jgi:hypothetical protein
MGFMEFFLLNIILFFVISLLFKMDKIEKKLQELTDLDNKEKQVNNEQGNG